MQGRRPSLGIGDARKESGPKRRPFLRPIGLPGKPAQFGATVEMADSPTTQVARGRRVGLKVERLGLGPVRFERREAASLLGLRLRGLAPRTPCFALRPRRGRSLPGRKPQERLDEFERFEKRPVPERSHEPNAVSGSASAAKPHAVVGFALGEKRKAVRAAAERTRTVGFREVSGVHPGRFENLRPASFGRPKEPIDAFAVLHASWGARHFLCKHRARRLLSESEQPSAASAARATLRPSKKNGRHDRRPTTLTNSRDSGRGDWNPPHRPHSLRATSCRDPARDRSCNPLP